MDHFGITEPGQRKQRPASANSELDYFTVKDKSPEQFIIWDQADMDEVLHANKANKSTSQ
jgi:hypothetical protein